MNHQLLDERRISLELAENSSSLSEYLGLGASLYIPTTKPKLRQLLQKKDLQTTKSIILCLEDAVADRDLSIALKHVEELVSKPLPHDNLFIRPRNIQVLNHLLSFSGIEQFQGVVLPKVDEHNLIHYAEILAQRPEWKVMPTIETSIAFSRKRLQCLREACETVINQILCIRIGVNDLFSIFGLKRLSQATVYDTMLRSVIDDIVLTFRPNGYFISAPVFDFLDNEAILSQEITRDLAYGLWSKTAIHPQQIKIIENHYQVPCHEVEMAKAILVKNVPAVFKLHGQMCEPVVHRRWAKSTLERARIYGLKSSD